MWQNWIRWTAGDKWPVHWQESLNKYIHQCEKQAAIWKHWQQDQASLLPDILGLCEHGAGLSWSMEIQVLELQSISKLRVFLCSPTHDHVQVIPYDLPILFIQVGNISTYPSNCLFSSLFVTFLLSFQENLESQSDNLSSHYFLRCWQCVQSQVMSANSFMTATGYLAYEFSH